MNWKLLQAWALRLAGAMEMLAFGAVFMPRDWMEAIHAAMGLTEMPKGPVFDSVMRQVTFTYGLHGVALWLIERQALALMDRPGFTSNWVTIRMLFVHAN